MVHAPASSLTRRGLLAADGALGLDAALAACGSETKAAAERLRKAAQAKKDIKVPIGSGYSDIFYVSTPARPADTLFFKELGVNLIVPDKPDPAAVKAGQVVPRVTEPIRSYAKCAPLMEDLAKALENAKKVA